MPGETQTVRVRVLGLDEAQAYFGTLRSGAAALGKLSVLVGSGVHYARYQELGTRHFPGRYFLTNALAHVRPRIAPKLLAAVEHGPRAVLDAGLALGYQVQREAQAAAPVRTGTLRRSIHTVVAGR